MQAVTSVRSPEMALCVMLPVYDVVYGYIYAYICTSCTPSPPLLPTKHEIKIALSDKN